MSEREIAEAAIREAVFEESGEDLYENAPCGYLSTAPDGRIVRANQTFARWTGYAIADLTGKRFQDLLSPGGRIYHETHYAPLLRMQGSVREIAVDIVCADGSTLPALVNSVLRRDKHGEPSLIRTTVFDATERRRYEMELIGARRRAEESEARARVLAQTLQASLIPPSLPAIPGFDLAAMYRPAWQGDEVGGDFYDVFETIGGDWAVVMGDVCGKGAEAAAVTALVRYTVRAAAMQTRQPRGVLATANQALLNQHSDRFCTAVYARVRTKDGRLRLTTACAGHPLPLLVNKKGEISAVGRPGTLLGVIESPDLENETFDLHHGDVVCFFTDGITEGRRNDGAFYGEERLAELLVKFRESDASEIAQAVLDDVLAFQSGVPRDDIALVVLKMPMDR